MLKYIIFITFLCVATSGFSQTKFKGRVITEEGKPLAGATVKAINDSSLVASVDEQGNFIINAAGDSVMVMASHIGYRTEVARLLNHSTTLLILKTDERVLQEVIVSTGYQKLPKERAAGSFVQINNKLLNRRVSPDILSRLEDVTSGISFNRKGSSVISIRGQSTLFSNAEPLIVVDNFPYDGDITTINPNDVESITVLKDAAASSIWGARAGNGVIVITTKKGRANMPPTITTNHNLTIGERPDLFYEPKMSTADYIDIERKLFDEGYFLPTEQSANKTALSPVVELLIQKRDNPALGPAIDAQIESLKAQDVRNDISRYLYRLSQNEQHAFSIAGASGNNTYFLSTGYDNELKSLIRNQSQRLTLNANNTYASSNNKLQLSAGIYFTSSKNSNNNSGTQDLNLSATNALYPYARLVDDTGLPITINHDYRADFVNEAQSNGLLNWQYNPIQEIEFGDNRHKNLDYRINTALNYSVLKGLNLELRYQHTLNNAESRKQQVLESYYTRDLINRFTIVNADGSLSRPIPLGDILDLGYSKSISNDARFQITYNANWKKHAFNFLSGAEVRDRHLVGSSSRLYGYDPEHASSKIVDEVINYTSYINPAIKNMVIPNLDNLEELTDRFLSYYSNAGYTFNSRYILSASARFDQSNLFGVKSNQKGVPLWSAGIAWNISEESFYKFSMLPYLKLRLTYGTSGNTDKTTSAYTTASYNPGNSTDTKLPFASIDNPPNPSLRWEKIQTTNLGLDFGLKDEVLTGSAEYFIRKGYDLIGLSPFPPSSGITTFKGNIADTEVKGLDISLQGNIRFGKFSWQPNLLISHTRERVTGYNVKFTATDLTQGLTAPIMDRPLYAIYSYQWAGLDPTSGDPMGYMDGAASTDIASIMAAATIDDLVFHGSARPVLFGSFRNGISWGAFSLSANLSYRLGYYFRTRSITYSNNYGLGNHSDYASRWMKPSDELYTNVPSVPQSANANRDRFYNASSVLVHRADNIRFQDVSLQYTLKNVQLPAIGLAGIQVYGYLNNIGVLWRANKIGEDPDFADGMSPRTVALGLKLSL